MLIDSTIETIDRYQSGNLVLDLTEITDSEDFDYDDQNTDYFSVGKKVRIDLADMDYVSWKRELEKDAENLELLSLMIADITPEHDTKLPNLVRPDPQENRAFPQSRQSENHHLYRFF